MAAAARWRKAQERRAIAASSLSLRKWISLSASQLCSTLIDGSEFTRRDKWRDHFASQIGPAFDQRKFHDAILALGSVPLTVLEQRMAQFIADGGNNPAR